MSHGHRRRSGWNSGGTHGERRRWVGAEWGEVWGEMFPPQPIRGSGERHENEDGFWRILKATEHSFLYLYDKT